MGNVLFALYQWLSTGGPQAQSGPPNCAMTAFRKNVKIKNIVWSPLLQLLKNKKSYKNVIFLFHFICLHFQNQDIETWTF